MVLLVDLIMYVVYLRDMTRNSKEALDSGVKVLSEYVANSIDSFNAMNISKIRSSRVMEYEDDMTPAVEFVVRRRMKNFAGISTLKDIEVTEVYIKDDVGNRIYWNEEDESLEEDYKDKEFYKYIEENEATLFTRWGSSVWRAFSDSPDKVYIMTQVRNEDTLTYEGILCIAINSKYLKNLTKNFEGYKVIRDENGAILYCDEEIRDKVEQSNGLDVTGYMEASSELDKWHWNITGLLNQADELKGAKRLLWSVVIVEIAVFMFVAMLMYFITTDITFDIGALVSTFRRIDKGEDPGKITYRSKNEVAYLCEEFNRMNYKLRQNAEELARNNTLREKAEYNALMTQMNPHFLYNTLESIRAMARINEQCEIVDVIQKLSGLLRVSLTGDANEVKLYEELQYVRQYLDLQNVITSKAYDYEIEIDDDAKDCLVPKLILQPIVENSIIHGLKDMNGDALIVILAYIKDGILNIKVSDNGVGVDQSVADRILSEEEPEEIKRDRAHIGIKSIQKRISKRYGKKCGMSIESEKGNGMTVSLWIPAREDIA